MYQRNVLLDRIALAVLDATGVLGAALLAPWLRRLTDFGGDPSPLLPWTERLSTSIVAAVVFLAVLAFNGFYRSPLPAGNLSGRLSRAALLSIAILLTFSLLAGNWSNRGVSILLLGILSVPTLLGTRWFHRSLARRVRSLRHSGRRVAIIGVGATAKKLGRALLEDPAYYTLVGYIHEQPGWPIQGQNGARVLGNIQDLNQIVADHSIDEVIVATPKATRQRQQQLVGECMALGIRWRLVPDIAGLAYDRVDVDIVGDLPTVGVRGSHVVGYNWALKRAFDLVVASISLIVLSPVMLLVAVAVKATPPGPVLYRQDRIGHQGKTFTLLKFRTMRSDAKAEVHEKYTSDWILGKSGSPEATENGAPNAVLVHKLTTDDRVTPVGKLLRATSIDELPQLWNVLRGEMSIVGPRPPLSYEVDKYTEAHKRRFEALPGITGLWQVSGRNRLSFEEMVRLDISYIENWSLQEDLRILMRTVPAVLSGRGH